MLDVAEDNFSVVTSIGNTFNATMPFVSNSNQSNQSGMAQTTFATNVFPAYSLSNVFECNDGSTTSSDQRSTCTTVPYSWWLPSFMLSTFDDQVAVVTPPPPMPTLPPVRPEVTRNSIIVSQPSSSTIQAAVNQLDQQEGLCGGGDYDCPNIWSVIYLPEGAFPITQTIQIPGGMHLQIVGVGPLTELYWNNPNIVNGNNSFIFKLNSPSHVVIRDMSLDGGGATGIGGAILGEVNDVASSRVLTDALNTSLVAVNRVGNATFENRQLELSSAVITGNGTLNAPGFFSFFGGNLANITVGAGASLMVQDTWYEGSDSRYVTCPDAANITVQSSQIVMGGWHGSTPDTLTTFNVDGCSTQTAIIDTNLVREIAGSVSPLYSMKLTSASGPNTNVLVMNSEGNTSNYGGGQDVIPQNATGPSQSLDQGYVVVDPASTANYFISNSTFSQGFVFNGGTGGAPVTAGSGFIKDKQSGLVQAGFERTMLSQTLDPRKRASGLIAPIADSGSTDIQIYNVYAFPSQGIQLVPPGGTAVNF